MSNRKTNRKSTRTTARSNKVSAVGSTGSSTSSVTFVSPRGKAYTVDNVASFARRFNLDRSALSKVARGERQSHKSWTVQG
jgi:hypothetical protein